MRLPRGEGLKTVFFRDESKRRTDGLALRIRAPMEGTVRRFGTACFERFAYMDVGGRAPTVGALGDAGVIAETRGSWVTIEQN